MNINQKKLSQWTSLVLIVLIFWVWAQAFLTGSNSFDSEESGRVQTMSSTPSTFNKQSIADFNIFGSAEVLSETPLMAGKSSLELTLNGTIASDNRELGLAYVTNQQGIQEKFKVGDKIFDLAKLKEIHKDHIVISRSGKTEKIAMSNTRRPASNLSNNAKTSQQKLVTKNNILKHLKTPPGQNWQEAMEQQKFDPNKISSIVSNVNLMTNQAGQIKGLKVSNLAQSSLLKKAGLMSNDIITAINGQTVNAGNMLTIKQNLEKSPNANVTIKRNGRVQNIQINISDL